MIRDKEEDDADIGTRRTGRVGREKPHLLLHMLLIA